MNYKAIFLMTGLFIATLPTQASDSLHAANVNKKESKKVSIAKKLSAVLGIASVCAAGGGALYYFLYLRNIWAQQVALKKAIDYGDFETIKTLLQQGVRIPKKELWCQGSLLEEIIVNGGVMNNESLTQGDFRKGFSDILTLLKGNTNEQDEIGATPLFATMHQIRNVVSEIGLHSLDKDKQILIGLYYKRTKLFEIMDILIENEENPNVYGPETGELYTDVPKGTLLHAAASIPKVYTAMHLTGFEMPIDISELRQQVIDKVKLFKVNLDAKDSLDRTYDQINA